MAHTAGGIRRALRRVRWERGGRGRLLAFLALSADGQLGPRDLP